MEESKEPGQVTICMIGFTGSGKSSLANELINAKQDKFKLSEGSVSCTEKI